MLTWRPSRVAVAVALAAVCISRFAEARRDAQDDVAQREVPFERVSQDIKGSLSQAANKLVQSSLAQADITKAVANNMGQYNSHVKQIATTMGDVMKAKSLLTKAYHEDIARAEDDRVRPLQVDLRDVTGEDFHLSPGNDFAASHLDEPSAQISHLASAPENLANHPEVDAVENASQGVDDVEVAHLENGATPVASGEVHSATVRSKDQLEKAIKGGEEANLTSAELAPARRVLKEEKERDKEKAREDLRDAVAGKPTSIDEAAKDQDNGSDEGKQLQVGKEVDTESDATKGTEQLSAEKKPDEKQSEDDDRKSDKSDQEDGAPDEGSKNPVQKDPIVRDVQSDGEDVSVIDPESSDDQDAATETNQASPKTGVIEDAEIVSDVDRPPPAKSSSSNDDDGEKQGERAGEAPENQAGDDERNEEDSQLAKVAASLAQLASAGHRYSARHRRSPRTHNRHSARLVPTRHIGGRATSVLHRRSRVAPAYLRGGYGLTGTAKARSLQRYLRKFGHAHTHAMRSHRARKEVRARQTHRTVAVQPRSFTVHHRRGHRRHEYY